ncbi:MAG: hypothetical protein KDB82_16440 [Planctomycetes bacterium]|nr:hypothetical protein [Planctomycetota bacterium]
MKRTIRTTTLLALLVMATPLVASSLSVVPLAKALQNPELAKADRTSKDFWDAANAVREVLLNQPKAFTPIGKDNKGEPVAPELDAEQERFCTRLSQLARYRDTRVGKLFFRALESTPGVENLPDNARTAEVTVRWPVVVKEYTSHIRVRVAARRVGETWLISEFAVSVEGAAAAPIGGMAPYFSNGPINPLLLDAEPIDYLVGRNPDDRTKPESERAPFDYNGALDRVFETEEGAYAKMVEALLEATKPDVSVGDRIKALRPYLATNPQRTELAKAGNDPDGSVKFWKEMRAQFEKAATAPMPSSVPKLTDSAVHLRYQLLVEGELVAGATQALRLRNGKVAPRGRLSDEEVTQIQKDIKEEEAHDEQGDASGN